MNKQVSAPQATVFCGIDVSARSLSVALIEPDHAVTQREFPNSASGHKALLNWLAKHNAKVRVSLEATGIYSLDLALALDAEPRIELAVLNPKLVNRFAQTLRRSKTDKADALVSTRLLTGRVQPAHALHRLAEAWRRVSASAHDQPLHRIAGGRSDGGEKPPAHRREYVHHATCGSC